MVTNRSGSDFADIVVKPPRIAIVSRFGLSQYATTLMG
ncbi:hypothetical protein OCQ_16340 [Mycobacterium paraintracellulare]|nr:hypothetical protein OCQ_16340 [Mycobacterium paraintracellulare]